MKFFKTKQTQPVATPVTPVIATIPENHVSKKKKNTYQIKFSPFAQADLFSLCKNTPLAVVVLNGKQVQENNGLLSCTEFPNPCATRMAANQRFLSEALGSKISTQIIEYLDKATGKPVIQVYPDSFYIFDGYEENCMAHLNHASRRDLNKQIELRKKLLSQYMAQKNQK